MAERSCIPKEVIIVCMQYYQDPLDLHPNRTFTDVLSFCTTIKLEFYQPVQYSSCVMKGL